MRDELLLPDFALNIRASGKKGSIKIGSKGGASTGGAPTAIDLKTLKKLYGTMRAMDVLSQCMYQVKIEDVFGIGGDIPWFKNKDIGYLVTEADVSFGGAEAENSHAGSYEFSLLTKRTADDMDMTFIETINGDIFKSFRACRKRAFNEDGTVNEPRKYAFKLSIAIINPKKHTNIAPVGRAWIVGVKEGRTEVSSAGRSEIIKSTITFQKLMPTIFLK